MSSSANDRSLPKKENDLFRSLIKCYEQKQYKKGIKNADGILKKFPNHGETQAMKGLILNCMEKKEEAYELVKCGLKNDVRSHVCWHVFGLLYRSDRNYKEAIKCYLNALRIDKDNQNILRDLSYLQVQMRDMAGFAETRRKLLVLKPSVKVQWLSYAVANYFNGDYSTANDVVVSFLESSNEEKIPYEHSELLLFQNKCFEERCMFTEAVQHLDDNREQIVDVLSCKVKRAELLTKLGRHDEARDSWLSLLTEQPDNYRFHSGFQVAALELDSALSTNMLQLKRLELPSTVLQLSECQRDKLRREYEESIPSSSSRTKIQLDLCTGESFRRSLDDFMRAAIRAGKPSLYNDICALIRVPDPLHKSSRTVYATDAVDYRAHPTTAIVMDLLDGYITNLSANGTFEPSPSAESEREVPTTLMWALFLRCHMHGACGRFPQALRDIERAIDHTPTSLDCLYKRARILKLAGDYMGAAEAMDYNRSLDLQDRYVNNKATKYFLRANRVQEGMDTIAMFTKHDGDSEKMLYDLQCIWYEIEVGQAYERLKKWGPALKKYYAVEKHFTDFMEDQFDFHGFCIRKSTLRAYLDSVANLDNILAHKFFQRAGQGALRVLLRRLDSSENETVTESNDLSTMTAAERKKEKAKQKKLKKKEASAADGGGEDKKGSKKAVSKDDDPNGAKLLEKDPLEEAGRWSEYLTRHRCKDPKTYELVCEVMTRRGKYALAVRALCQGLALDPHHPGMVVQLLKFSRLYFKVGAGNEEGLSMPDIVKEVIHEKLCALLGGEGETALLQYCDAFVSLAASGALTLPHRVAAARCVMMFSGDKQRAAALMLDGNLWSQRGVTVSNATAALELLSTDLNSIKTAAPSFLEAFQSHFPLANQFNAGGSPVYKGVQEAELVD